MLAARALSLSLVLALVPRTAAAADGPNPIEWDPTRDYILTGLGAAFALGAELSKDHFAPVECNWCEPNSLDANARDLLLLGNISAARKASDLLAFVALPAAVSTHQILAARSAGGDTEDGLVDMLVIFQAAILALDVNQIVKLAVGRQRPFVHYGNYEEPGRLHDSDDNLSFYSGHSSLAFSLAAAAGTVSSLRGYDSTPWVWGVGMTVAASIGYLRIAGDKHYLTDVLTGAAIGTAFGIAVPRLLHPRESSSGDGQAQAKEPKVSFVPIPLGVYMTF